MKYFAEFYADYGEGLVPCCGSDATIRIDGRLSLDNMIQVAINHAYKVRRCNKFDAFKIIMGESLLSTRDVTNLIHL